jgi:hypothetical protein
MKRIIFAACILALVVAGNAQGSFSLTEGVPSMQYSLPRTELVFAVEIEKRTEKPGVFASFAQRFLGATKIIQDEKVAYSFKGISLNPKTIPDPARRYGFVPAAGGSLNKLVVDEQGILLGLNIPVPVPVNEVKKEVSVVSDIPVTNFAGLLPLTREFMMAGTQAKLAEGAASQIYDIRASRLALLAGDMDKTPDAETMKVMLKGLDQKERELTELFIGTTLIETEIHAVSVIPEKDKLRDILFRLSAKRGVVAKDDLGGEPFHVTYLPERIPVNAADADATKRRAADPIGLFTVVPAQTLVRVGDGVKTFLERSLYIPQLGEITGLSESVLKTPQIRVSVHPETGRLLKIDF